MDLRDITVEVRDKALNRVGVIRHEDLDLKAEDLHNDVGAWTLTLPIEHPLCATLRTPGAGIIVTGPQDVLFSGPVTSPEYGSEASDPAGTVVFQGVTDDVALQDALCYPDPTNSDPTSQTLAHDVRTGKVETIMHAYVNANIGPGATVARRKAALALGTDGARGPVVTKRARFNVLGNLLAELAVLAGLGFRLVQRGNALVFETYEVANKAALVRLDVRNNTLASQKVQVSAPGATHVIVAGQDEGVDRQFHLGTTPASLAAATDWGRRIERWLDQRQTDDPTEHARAASEVLEKEGLTSVAVQVVPMSDDTMRFGVDWYIGDLVSVVVLDQELPTLVTGFVMSVGPEGTFFGARLGNPEGFDLDASLVRRVKDTASRLDELEANAEVSAGLAEEVEQQAQAVGSLTNRMGGVEDRLNDVEPALEALTDRVDEIGLKRTYATSVAITVPAGPPGTLGSAVVTFPTDQFSAPPRVFVTQSSLPAGSSTLIAKMSGATATQVTVYLVTPINLGSAVGPVGVDLVAVESA